MASSGSTDFNLTRDEIIHDALIHCGAIEQGEAPAAAETAFAARQLNRMVKTLQAKGIRLWTRREAYLFLVVSQGRYVLDGSTEHFASVRDTIRTELASDMSSGAGSLTVDSTTGMAAADNIGVVLDDGTIEWGTIASVDSSTTLTLDGTIDDDDAATDNTVFTYTTKLVRPLRIIDAQRTNNQDVDTPINMISHQEYQRLPNKTIVGLTNEAYYQPERPDGYLYLWPEPESANDRIRLTCLFPIEDFDTSANNPDLPQEWLDYLTWNLAKKLLPSYGVPRDVRDLILLEAAESYETMSGWDREPEATSFAPDFDRSG